MFDNWFEQMMKLVAVLVVQVEHCSLEPVSQEPVLPVQEELLQVV